MPHMLSLGATPIPRTLELMQTGHLTSYAIDEMPPGRQSVQTFVLPDTESHIEKVDQTLPSIDKLSWPLSICTSCTELFMNWRLSTLQGEIDSSSSAICLVQALKNAVHADVRLCQG